MQPASDAFLTSRSISNHLPRCGAAARAGVPHRLDAHSRAAPGPDTAFTPPSTMSPTPAFRFDNSYARELTGCYLACRPATAPQPRLLFLNRGLAQTLGLDADALDGQAGAALFAGNALRQTASGVRRK